MPSAIFLGPSPLRENQGAVGQEVLGTLLVLPLKAEGRESFFREEILGNRRAQSKRRDDMPCDRCALPVTTRRGWRERRWALHVGRLLSGAR